MRITIKLDSAATSAGLRKQGGELQHPWAVWSQISSGSVPAWFARGEAQ